MKCPKCQIENPETRKFCSECGAKLLLVCPKCGFENLPSDKFCGGCGQKLEEPLAVWKEPFLEGERKQATVLFSDVSGYTGMSERLDPEEVKEIMGQVFGGVTSIVNRYDGSIEKFIGDAVVAFFGVPKAHEDDPVRAIRAAREIHAFVDAMSPRVEQKVGRSLSMHTGINTGLVVTGQVDQDGGITGVLGDTINVASRLSSLAKAGTILVGENTYLQTRGYFEFEKQEPTRVKGKTEAVSTYKILEPKHKVERLKGLAVQGISSALVGRDAEFVALKGCLNRLLDGQGGIVCIIGEAGIGKSRLMAEIHNHIRNTQANSSLLWLEGRTLSYGQKISYWLFQEILWQYAGITEDDSEAEAWQKLEGRISALFGEETREILPYLATLLGLGVRGEYAESTKYLDGKSMGSQIYLTSRRFFDRLARFQPLVLVFEDLHWVDESSMLLIEHLLPLILRVPILICCVSRTESKIPIERIREIATREYERCYTELYLSPLSQSDSLQMMRNLMEIDNLSSTIREKIVHKVDGNPFFLEEIMRSLIDTGAVVHDSSTGRWKTTQKLDVFTIPDTIQGVIMARVDRLGEEIKQVLRTAAVIGRNFLYRVLKTIVEEIRELDRDLDQLQTVQLIRIKQEIPELEYIFKHALVQEATYGSILLQRRRELHSKVGQAIEALFPDRLEEFYSLLAYHYARAENWEKAQEYLFKAGDQAGKIAADTEALAHYRQAIETYTRVFGDKWDPIQRGSLEQKMGEAFYRKGDYDQAMEYLQRALVYFGRPRLPKVPLKVRLGVLEGIAIQVCHQMFSRWLVKKWKGLSDPVVEEVVKIYDSWASMEALLDPVGLLRTTLTCLNYCDRKGYAPGIASEYASLGFVAHLLSFSSLERFFLKRALTLAMETGHPLALTRAHMVSAITDFNAGRLASATDHGSKSRDVCRKAGYPNLIMWGTATVHTAMAYVFLSEFEAALLLSNELMNMGEDTNDPFLYGCGLWPLSEVRDRQGKLEDCTTNAKKLTEVFEGIQFHNGRVLGEYVLGRCCLRLEKIDTSLDICTQSDAYRVKHDTKLYEHFVHLGILRAYMANIEGAHARDRERWLKKARQTSKKVLHSAQLRRIILPEAIRLQGVYDWLTGRQALAQKCWQRSIALAEEMGMRYELGTTHLEMGQRLKDRAHLEKAEAIFAEIGAEFDLAQARKLVNGGAT